VKTLIFLNETYLFQVYKFVPQSPPAQQSNGGATKSGGDDSKRPSTDQDNTMSVQKKNGSIDNGQKGDDKKENGSLMNSKRDSTATTGGSHETKSSPVKSFGLELSDSVDASLMMIDEDD